MATIARTRRMTADEFFAALDVPEGAELVDGQVFVQTWPDLVDGEVVEVTTPPPVHGWIGRNVIRALETFGNPRGLGEVFGDGIPYRIGAHRVRVPDASFIRAERVSGPPPRKGGWPMAPDLAVEVLSPSDTHAVVRRKLADYFGAGTRLVWLVDPDERGVEVHAPGAAPIWIGEAGTLDGGDVLPGFTLPVAAVFAGVPPAGRLAESGS